jgi:predicted secreted protein
MAAEAGGLSSLKGGQAVLVGLAAALGGLALVLVVLYFRSGALIFSMGTSVAIYFVIWWTCLFAVLPFRVRSQKDAGIVEPGSDPGAPAHAALLWYVVINSGISALISVVFLVFLAPMI